MNADGSKQRPLLTPRRGANAPEWSPDGRRIAFSGYETHDSQIYVMNANGTSVRRLTGRAYFRTSGGDRCTIFGTARADVLQGTAGEDVICGLGANDTIVGARAGDTLDGGAGNDLIVGGPGVDSIVGGAGRDVIRAVDGARDWIDGGPGVDTAGVDPGDWTSLVEIRR